MKTVKVIFFILGFFSLAFLIRPPVSGGKVTSIYGIRFANARFFHTGTDIALPTGSPVRSVSWGSVQKTGFTDRNGNYIIISHLPGIESRYLHLDSIHITTGDRINPSIIIGKVGNTGISSGSHLHLEIRVLGIPVPAYILCFPGRVVKWVYARFLEHIR